MSCLTSVNPSLSCNISCLAAQHLPWRTRLAVATCYAFEDAGKLEAAAKCTVHAMEKVPRSEPFPCADQQSASMSFTECGLTSRHNGR